MKKLDRIALASNTAKLNLDYAERLDDRIDKGIYIMAALGYYRLIEDIEGIKRCRESIKRLELYPLEDTEEFMMERAKVYLDLHEDLCRKINEF